MNLARTLLFDANGGACPSRSARSGWPPSRSIIPSACFSGVLTSSTRSVSTTTILTTLRWPRPSIGPTLRFHPSTLTLHTSLVCSHDWLLIVAKAPHSHQNRLVLHSYGSEPCCGSLFSSPRMMTQHVYRSTSPASSCHGTVHLSRTSTLPFVKNATTRATSRTGTGLRVRSRCILSIAIS